MTMRYTVRQNGRVVGGLQLVTRDNANLMMLRPEKPLAELELDEHTWATDRLGESYFVIREE